MTWSLDDSTLTITGSGTMYDYEPGTAPWSGQMIRTVDVGYGVKGIGTFAFSDCKLLTEVFLPETLRTIGGGAFYKCTALPSIEIPSKITSIPTAAFQGCWNMSRVIMNGNVQTIGMSAFQNCASLEEISLDGVKTIGEMAFAICKSLTEITIPSSVQTIGSMAFDSCTSLKKITFIGNTVADIAGDAFFNVTAEICYTEGTITDPPSYGGNLNWTAQHNMKKVAAKAATCELSGNSEYWICKNAECAGKAFANESGDIETTLEATKLEALGHDWQQQKYDACTSKEIVSKCSRCAKTKSESRTPTHTPGEAKMEISRIPENLTGSGTYDEVVYCLVCGKEISRAEKELRCTVELSNTTYVYDNTEKKPYVTVKMGTKLIDPTLYTVQYSDNVNAGTASVTVTANSGAVIRGSAQLSFTISPKTLSDQQTVLSRSSYTYSGKQKKPAVEVAGLVENKDYMVQYINNIKVGKATAIVTGIGNYSGNLAPIEFTILPKSTSLTKISSAANSLTVSWKRQKPQVSGYQVSCSRQKDFSDEKIKTISGSKNTSKTIKKLKKKAKYYVRVRTYKNVGGERQFSKWSKVKSIGIN